MPQESAVVCPTCKGTVAMRVSRTGFLQSSILCRLGIFPWKCGACGATFLVRKRKLRAETREGEASANGRRSA